MQNKPVYSDQELLLRFNNGEEDAMRTLFDMYNLALVHFSNNITKDITQSEDAVTEAFIQLWNRRTSFHSLPAIKSFLYQTIKNAGINWLKHRTVVLKSEPALLEKHRLEENNLQNHLLEAELVQFIYQEIFRLPRSYSEVISLLFIEGLSYELAAASLHITEANLRMRKSRAIEQLRIRLIEKGLLMFFLKLAVAKHFLCCL